MSLNSLGQPDTKPHTAYLTSTSTAIKNLHSTRGRALLALFIGEMPYDYMRSAVSRHSHHNRWLVPLIMPNSLMHSAALR
jgi:hypothetical protein